MQTYKPRLTAPDPSDPHWISTAYGGLNECIIRKGNSCLPNCVGYAWGRFREILGSRPSLSRNNAGRWYDYKADGYTRGLVPKLGAVICWDNPGYAGHVAIVEQINKNNGSIVTSNSSYRGDSFYIDPSPLRPPNYLPNQRYIFQGFIYNPAVVGDQVISIVPGVYGTDYQFSRNDALVREVGYIDSKYKPSINMSNIKLSIINYYSGLSFLLNSQTSDGTIIQDMNLDKIESVPRVIVQYLTSDPRNLNTAAAVGIIANIKHETEFNTASEGDYENGVPTSFGICQWHKGRGAAMKKMAGSNWATNLTGQLEYLWYELTGKKYINTLNKLRQVSNNEPGARRAADIFVREFEVPANLDANSLRRQDTASEFWNKLVPQLTTTTSSQLRSM